MLLLGLKTCGHERLKTEGDVLSDKGDFGGIIGDQPSLYPSMPKGSDLFA